MTRMLELRPRLRVSSGAASCFGLGRYLYYFTGTWVDLDERKRPKSVPQLAGWATPTGWREGLRPRCVAEVKPQCPAANAGGGDHSGQDSVVAEIVLREIEGMEKVIGKRMYRGILKTVARVWNPKEIQDKAIQERVLAHMQAAERGLRRAEGGARKGGAGDLCQVLGSLRLSSLDQVDNLKTLQEIVIALESRCPVMHEQAIINVRSGLPPKDMPRGSWILQCAPCIP